MSDEIFGFLLKKRYLSFSIIAESQLILFRILPSLFHIRSLQIISIWRMLWLDKNLNHTSVTNFSFMHKSRFEQKVTHKTSIKTFQLYIAKSYDIKAFGKNTAKRIKGVIILIFLVTKPNVTVGKLILQRF